MYRFLKQYSEVLIWNGALVLLACMDIESTTSFCLFKAIGFKWCPGCGLGHAIYYALHFDFQKSLNEHILGIPATIIIFYQACKSIYNINIINKIKTHESAAAIKNIP